MDEFGWDIKFCETCDDVTPELIVAYACERLNLSAKNMGMIKEIYRGAAKFGPGGQHVPENFAKRDNSGLARI